MRAKLSCPHVGFLAQLGRAGLVACSLFALSSCSEWRVEPLPLPVSGPMHVMGPVQLRLRTGALVNLEHVIVTPDSIIGVHLVPGAESLAVAPERAAFARSDVKETRIHEDSNTLTALLIVVLLLLPLA